MIVMSNTNLLRFELDFFHPTTGIRMVPMGEGYINHSKIQNFFKRSHVGMDQYDYSYDIHLKFVNEDPPYEIKSAQQKKLVPNSFGLMKGEDDIIVSISYDDSSLVDILKWPGGRAPNLIFQKNVNENVYKAQSNCKIFQCGKFDFLAMRLKNSLVIYQRDLGNTFYIDFLDSGKGVPKRDLMGEERGEGRVRGLAMPTDKDGLPDFDPSIFGDFNANKTPDVSSEKPRAEDPDALAAIGGFGETKKPKTDAPAIPAFGGAKGPTTDLPAFPEFTTPTSKPAGPESRLPPFSSVTPPKNTSTNLPKNPNEPPANNWWEKPIPKTPTPSKSSEIKLATDSPEKSSLPKTPTSNPTPDTACKSDSNSLPDFLKIFGRAETDDKVYMLELLKTLRNKPTPVDPSARSNTSYEALSTKLKWLSSRKLFMTDHENYITLFELNSFPYIQVTNLKKTDTMYLKYTIGRLPNAIPDFVGIELNVTPSTAEFQLRKPKGKIEKLMSQSSVGKFQIRQHVPDNWFLGNQLKYSLRCPNGVPAKIMSEGE
jgi:hypothetical protein